MTDRDTNRAIALAEAAMAKLGWNIQRVADEAGITPDTVGDFLSGKRWPQVETRGKLEKALNLELGSLTSAALGKELTWPKLGDVHTPSVRMGTYVVPDDMTPEQEAALKKLVVRFAEGAADAIRGHGSNDH